MESLPLLLIAALGGYLLGSVPFAVIVSRAFGLADPRQHGSGNPGATNVLRTGNKAAALLTLLGDALKGWLAMFLAAKLGAGETAIAVAGVAAFIGHVFPFTLGFRGGKGVATALGVMLGFGWQFFVIGGLTWLGVAALFRYSSLASMTMAAVAPVVAIFLFPNPAIALCVGIMSAVLILRHRSNIAKLRAGTESRIGSRSAD
jgi:glycerol-3-phosphate acyltransferase PlsY